MKRSLLFSIMFCFTFSSLTTAEIDQNVYSNNEVGLSITKPKDWFFLSTAPMSENRKGMRLKDEELSKKFADEARLPLVVISKYPDPYSRPDVTPTVEVVMSPLGNNKNTSAIDLINPSVNILKDVMSDVGFLEKPSQINISGFNAAKTVLRYSTLHQSGSIDIKNGLYVIIRGEFVFSIGLSSPLNGPDISDAEFSSIIDSLRIDK